MLNTKISRPSTENKKINSKYEANKSMNEFPISNAHFNIHRCYTCQEERKKNSFPPKFPHLISRRSLKRECCGAMKLNLSEELALCEKSSSKRNATTFKLASATRRNLKLIFNSKSQVSWINSIIIINHHLLQIKRCSISAHYKFPTQFSPPNYIPTLKKYHCEICDASQHFQVTFISLLTLYFHSLLSFLITFRNN